MKDVAVKAAFRWRIWLSDRYFGWRTWPSKRHFDGGSCPQAVLSMKELAFEEALSREDLAVAAACRWRSQAFEEAPSREDVPVKTVSRWRIWL